MVGTFRLLKSVRMMQRDHSSGRFARVALCLEVSGANEDPIFEIETHGIWKDSAILGAKAALAATGNMHLRLAKVTQLDGAVADTDETDVWLAAVLATLDALQLSNAVNAPAWVNEEWSLEFKNGVILSLSSSLRSSSVSTLGRDLPVD